MFFSQKTGIDIGSVLFRNTCIGIFGNIENNKSNLQNHMQKQVDNS